MNTERMLKAIIENEDISRHIVKHTWMSGCSTEVSPITFWRNYVEVQLDTRENVFREPIKKLVADHPELFKKGLFCKNDESCPCSLRIFYA